MGVRENRAACSTGVVIANTSRDAFGTKPQAGACAIDYYGGFSEDAPPPSQRSAIVAPGGRLVFTLSAGNEEHSIAPAPDFQGYLVARCDFRYAHGAVLVSDGIGGAAGVRGQGKPRGLQRGMLYCGGSLGMGSTAGRPAAWEMKWAPRL